MIDERRELIRAPFLGMDHRPHRQQQQDGEPQAEDGPELRLDEDEDVGEEDRDEERPEAFICT